MCLQGRSKDLVSATDAGSVFLIVGFGVAVGVEFGSGRQQGPTVPDCVFLLLVRDDLDVESARLGAGFLLGAGDAVVDERLDVALQSASKVCKHRAAAGQDDVAVEAASDVDG